MDDTETTSVDQDQLLRISIRFDRESNMTFLHRLADTIIPANKLNDDGVPSISIATNITGIHSHVITNGTENNDTVYQACSISKAITALAVAKLVDQGVISYETKVADHVPRHIITAIVEPKTQHLMQYVTIGHLLSHRSGLSQHGFPGYEGEPPSMDKVFSGEAPANTPRIRFLSFPGSQTSYSGGGYCLLQLALEHITKKSFADWMQGIVLRPLGMTRSHYGDLPKHENNYAKAHFTAQQVGSVNSRGYFQFPELAAAGLWTTPSDLLKAALTIQQSLRSDAGYLSQETARKMLTTLEPNSQLNELSMAYGWSADRNFFAHAGDNDPGYQTYLLAAHDLPIDGPDKMQDPRPTEMRGAIIAFMTNSRLGFEAIKKCVAAIFYLREWPRPSSLPSSFGSMTSFIPYPAPLTTQDSQHWAHLVGTWSNGWRITHDTDGLKVQFKDIVQLSSLRLAATSTMFLNDDLSTNPDYIYVIDGLAISLRSVFRNDEYVIEVLQDERQILTRVE